MFRWKYLNFLKFSSKVRTFILVISFSLEKSKNPYFSENCKIFEFAGVFELKSDLDEFFFDRIRNPNWDSDRVEKGSPKMCTNAHALGVVSVDFYFFAALIIFLITISFIPNYGNMPF